MKDVDITFIKDLARTAAGEIARSTREVTQEKGGGAGDVVTKADLVSNTHIVDAITSAYPDHAIYAEETEHEVDVLNAQHVWIVDPLDGTTNFAFGMPLWCVTIAYASNGVVQMGVVYDPNRDEMFFARRGYGAFLNDQQVHVYQGDMRGTIANIDSPYAYEHFAQVYPAGDTLHKSGMRIVNLGCSALELAYVASGRLAVYISRGGNAWDWAAGSLLIAEAGGKTTTFDGGERTLHDEEMIATNGMFHDTIVSLHGSSAAHG